MNIFASILTLKSFRKVNYYTVLLEKDEKDLFKDFIDRHKKEHVEALEQIQVWLQRIGDEIGVREEMFRFEAYRGGDARALPPKARYLDFETSLRLYCMIVDTGNVIFFNGGVKTAEKAQDCPNVRPHFLMANAISKVIHQSIVDGDIRINDCDGLEFDEDFELEIK